MSAADDITDEALHRYQNDALRDAFISGAAWARVDAYEVTEAMVEAAADAIWGIQWRRAPFPSKASRTKARAALTAALNTMKEPNQ